MAVMQKLRQLTGRLSTRVLGSTLTTGTRRAAWVGVDDDIGYETNADLAGPQRYAAYRKLRRRVPVVAAYSRLVESIASKAKFVIDGMEEDDPRLEFIVGMMEGVSMADVQSHMVEALTHGYSLQEIVLMMDGGRWRVRTINRIPQTTIYKADLDARQVVSGFTQYVPKTVTIPREKCLYVKVGAGPFGEGVLADVAHLGLSYINLQQVFGTIDSNLRDIPDVTMPMDAYNDESNPFGQSARQLLATKNTKANPRVETPSDLQFGIDGSGGDRLIAQRQYEFERVDPVPIEDNDRLLDTGREIAVALNAEALLLGVDGTGSLALSKTQLSTLMQVVDGVLERAAQEYERMLRNVFRLNGWGDELKVVVDRSGWLQPNDAAEVLAMVQGMSLEVYGEAVTELLEQSGLPAPDIEAAIRLHRESMQAKQQGGGNDRLSD